MFGVVFIEPTYIASKVVSSTNVTMATSPIASPSGLDLLPKDFLREPASDIITSRVDFEQVNLPEYEGLYAVLLDDVLTPSECQTLLHAAEGSATTTGNGWERALVNVGGGAQMMIEDQRNCGRIIWDSCEVVAKVWQRIADVPEVQEIVRLHNVPKIFGNGPTKRNEVWKFTRPNERMRFLKYEGGEYFRPHCDGSYETPGGEERSYFTLHVYLSDAEVVTTKELIPRFRKGQKSSKILVGGATTFHSYDMKRRYDVLPKAGRVLLFQHRDLIHSGDDVVRGVKYTMRTDLMYALEKDGGASKSLNGRPTLSILEDEPDSDLEEGTDGVEEAMRYF